ncbi:hypothetical protein FB451DRAFT_1389290 [Mycena latifolia]|nr:hypothetical protein FB451DRAFT_1389290 [Mycena latifolia]
MQDRAQLVVSILLAFLALIPDNTLRYVALGITVCLAVIYVISIKRPSTLLRQLKETIEATDEIIRRAKLQCPLDHLSLLEAGVRLLEVRRSASMITCRILETERLTWAKYRLFSRDIAQCIRSVKAIRTCASSCPCSVHDVKLFHQLTVEAEWQRKFAEDINETEGMLATIRGYSTFWTGFDVRGHQAVRGNQPNTSQRQINAYRLKLAEDIDEAQFTLDTFRGPANARQTGLGNRFSGSHNA